MMYAHIEFLRGQYIESCNYPPIRLKRDLMLWFDYSEEKADEEVKKAQDEIDAIPESERSTLTGFIKSVRSWINAVKFNPPVSIFRGEKTIYRWTPPQEPWTKTDTKDY